MEAGTGVPCCECRGTGIRRIPGSHAAGAEDSDVETREGAPATFEVPCPSCGGAGTVWQLPELRFIWKSEAASRAVYELLLQSEYDVLVVDRFDGSLGFLVYLLESRFQRRVYLILADRREGIYALHLLGRGSRRESDVILAHEPLRRPREYRPGDTLKLCRFGSHPSVSILRSEPISGILFDRWRRGPFERVFPGGKIDVLGPLFDVVDRLEAEAHVRVTAGYRNPDEQLIGLLAVDEHGGREHVAVFPETPMRENRHYRVHILRFGPDGGMPRVLIPQLG